MGGEDGGSDGKTCGWVGLEDVFGGEILSEPNVTASLTVSILAVAIGSSMSLELRCRGSTGVTGLLIDKTGDDVDDDEVAADGFVGEPLPGTMIDRSD